MKTAFAQSANDGITELNPIKKIITNGEGWDGVEADGFAISSDETIITNGGGSDFIRGLGL
jgi:hypothetical protein